MKIGVVGCGYVFDHYMATWDRHPALELVGVADIKPERVEAVSTAYGVPGFGSLDELLREADVEVVVNLTSIPSHVEVTEAALRAGKHVYSEKPVAPSLQDARGLFEVAEAYGVTLACAPSNALSDSTNAAWNAIRDGAVGVPRLVYAELDDNPIYLMQPESWRSRTGAPWPYIEEYEQGCTVEHAAYHLTVLCALFGPVSAVTAMSSCLIPKKTDAPLDPQGTPDFSVGVLRFESGVVARLTCSIVAPADHSMRVIGDEGLLTIDTYRDYGSPIYVERFTPLTLDARKLRTIRGNSTLKRLFGLRGRQLPLPNLRPPAGGDRRLGPRPSRTPGGLVERVKRRELGLQDKCLGIAELVEALEQGRTPFPSKEFTLHITELVWALQSAGDDGSTYTPETGFTPLQPRSRIRRPPDAYAATGVWAAFCNALGRLSARLHRH
jgi:predicted dehydrogenase